MKKRIKIEFDIDTDIDSKHLNGLIFLEPRIALQDLSDRSDFELVKVTVEDAKPPVVIDATGIWLFKVEAINPEPDNFDFEEVWTSNLVSLVNRKLDQAREEIEAEFAMTTIRIETT